MKLINLSTRISLEPWKVILIVMVIALFCWTHPSLALNFGKTGAFFGIQPSCPLAKPYAELHEAFIPMSVVWSPDGKYIADMGMYDDVIHIWDVDKKKIVHIIQEKGFHSPNVAPDRHAIAWSPDGRYLAACTFKEVMTRIWDTTTWQQVATTPLPKDRAGSCISPIFSPDGQYFAYADDYQGDVFVYSTATWHLFAQTSFKKPDNDKSLPKVSHSVYSGERITFEPNGNIIAIAGLEYVNDNIDKDISGVVFWDVRQPPSNVGPSFPGQIFKVSGSGPLISNPSYPSGLPSPRLHLQYPSHIRDIAFRPDGQELAIGTAAPSTFIWDVNNEKLIASPLPEMLKVEGEIKTLVYTADERYLIANREGNGCLPYPGEIYFIDAKKHEVIDSLTVSNYGGLGYNSARNAIAVGNYSLLGGFKLYIWQIQ